MSYTDEEDNNDNINEYDSGSDSSGFSDDDQKIKLLSKKQKQILAFQGLVRNAKQHFNNCEFLNFQQDLKSINAAVTKNKWATKSYQMPKFFVKHMLEIYDKIKQMDPKNEKNQKEQRALKSLKKNFEKDLKHFRQLDIFQKHATLWKNESSDLGEMEHEDIQESDDDNAFIAVQDARDTNEEKKGDDEQKQNKNGDGDASGSDGSDGGGTDDDDASGSDDDDDDDTWSSWDDKHQHHHHKHEESADSSDGSDGGGAVNVDETEATKEKTFGIEAFDEETLAQMRYRSFWVKGGVTKVQTAKTKKKVRKPKSTKSKAKEKEPAMEAKAEKKEKEKEHRRKEKQRGPTKWSVNKILTIFQSVLSDRGKTSVNRDLIVSRLDELIVQCGLHKAEQARLTVISVLISFYFDTASRKTTGMSGTRWRKTRGLIGSMLKSLSKNIGVLRLSNDADLRLILKDDGKKEKEVKDEWMAALMEEEDNGGGNKAEKKKEANKIAMDVAAGFSVINTLSKKRKLDDKYQWVHGNMLSFIKKLTVEIWTNLKSLASKSALYEKRKQNTELLLNTYKKAVFYFGKLNLKAVQSEIEVLAMSAMHCDYDEKLDELKEKLQNKRNQSASKTAANRPEKLIFPSSNGQKQECILNLPSQKDCPIVIKAQFVFKNGSVRAQTAAMLYLIFFMALHNRFSLCRDLLLMSHLGSQTRIGSCGNIELQILYNRAISRFAVCAFFAGHWYTTMIVLQELFASNRYKILLAQGFIRAPPEISTSEQIKLQQLQASRMLPPHFHIQADLLEASHLFASLFCEIPNMAHNSYTNGFIRNAYFRKVWHQYLRRDLRVPPENTKDFILSVGIYMQNGEWSVCKDLCKKLRLWHNIGKKYGVEIERFVLKKVFSSVKRSCLRCYLYRYGSCYKDIRVSVLAEMFDLSEEHCKQFVAKLINDNNGKEQVKFASFDELTQCITIHSKPCLPIQKSALEYSEKLSFLIEQNEKLLGIYSRYSSYGGGGGDYKGKGKGKGKGKDDKNKGKNNWNKGGAQKKRGGTRFNRSGGGSSNAGQQNSSNRSQFGYKSVRTQLRSVRPKRT